MGVLLTASSSKTLERSSTDSFGEGVLSLLGAGSFPSTKTSSSFSSGLEGLLSVGSGEVAELRDNREVDIVILFETTSALGFFDSLGLGLVAPESVSSLGLVSSLSVESACSLFLEIGVSFSLLAIFCVLVA